MLLKLFCTLSILGLAAGRTTTLTASDALVSLAPPSAWTTLPAPDTATAGQYTRTRGATVSFSFAGQQVTVIGSSSGVYTVTLDGTQQFQYSKAESGHLFRASDLDSNDIHSLQISLEDTGAVLYLQQVKVAYANSLDLIPSLVSTPSPSISASSSTLPTDLATSPPASSGFVRTTRARTSGEPPSAAVSSSRSSFTSSTSLPITSGSFDPLPSPDSLTTSHASPGTIAGAVLGSLAGLALLIVLAIFCIRKRRADKESDYHDADTGQHRSFTGPVPRWGGDGGVGESPPRRLGDGAEVVGSGHGEAWAGRLSRSASWKRADRLSETRRFYGVRSGEEPPPRPSRSPAFPGLVMAETDSIRPAISLSPSPSVDTPSTLSISHPTRSPRKDLRIVVPPRSEKLPSTFLAGLGRVPSTRKDAPLPRPPQPERRPSHVAQEDYYSPTAREDARLSEVIEEPEDGVGNWGEEDRPHFFQTREVMPKYSAERDPRRV